MSEEKSYLASDLVTELQLPRSTINDWLTRYVAYLPSEARGKRRAYTAQALAVLREVAAWRNAGKSAFEIEQELSARYGIRAEEVTMPEEASPVTAPPPVAAGKEEDGELPALRRPMAEMRQEITSEFDRLAAVMLEVQNAQKKGERKARIRLLLGVLIFLLGIAAAAGAGVFGWFKYEKSESSATAQRQAVLTAQGDAGARLEALKAAQTEMTKMLFRQREEEKLLRAGFEKKSAECEKAFQKTLAAERARSAEERARSAEERARSAAELSRLKKEMAENFAAEKKAADEKLQVLQKAYEEKYAALTAERDSLRRRLTELETKLEKERRKKEAELRRLQEALKEARQKSSRQDTGTEKRIRNLAESCRILQKELEKERATSRKEIDALRRQIAVLEKNPPKGASL